MHKIDLRFIASNNKDLEKGLMFSEPLKENEGALFVFPYSRQVSFWNKNVSFPISLLFLNENMIIQDIGSLTSFQEEPCVSRTSNVKYVLELPLNYKNVINLDDICALSSDSKQIFIFKKG